MTLNLLLNLEPHPRPLILSSFLVDVRLVDYRSTRDIERMDCVENLCSMLRLIYYIFISRKDRI